MDDPDTSPGGMPSDGMDVDDVVQRAGTLPGPVADENENQLEGNTAEEGVIMELEQDSVNNNEGCYHGVGSSQHHEGPGTSVAPGEEPRAAKEKCTSEKNSPGCKACVNGAPPTGITPAETTQPMSADIPADSLQEIDLEPNVNHQIREEKPRLQSLFSVIREEFQQHDVASLPRCLHQIAETYFQEEEYDKAMQFIQLERLYHEQLLANLSAIQKQWESKWKKMAPEKIRSRSSEKGLNSEELERLACLCASHHEPSASKQKLILPEKIVIDGNNSIRLEELQKAVVAACKSGRESWSGVKPRRESQEGAEERRASSENSLSENRSLWAAPEHEHMDETYCSDESTLESHTYSPGPVGRPRSDCLSSGDVRNDTSCLLLDGTGSFKNAKDRVETSKESQSKVAAEGMLVSSPVSYSEPSNVFLQEGKSLELERYVGSTETATSEFGMNMLGQQLSLPSGEDTEQSSTVRTKPCITVCDDKAFKQSNTSLPESMERESVDHVTDDMTEVLSNEETRDKERSDMGLHCDSDDSENLPYEEVSYSTEDAVLEDSSISLDELAKRIEVEEIIPAEGLVSILKKQNESEEKSAEQAPQKPAKRRVRFQEMDDALDQEDLGGGSCFVLILLCVTTVFFSIVGTALYCTLGYVESAVCTDFADNMDFYYTHLLQGVNELKHWFSFS